MRCWGTKDLCLANREMRETSSFLNLLIISPFIKDFLSFLFIWKTKISSKILKKPQKTMLKIFLDWNPMTQSHSSHNSPGRKTISPPLLVVFHKSRSGFASKVSISRSFKEISCKVNQKCKEILPSGAWWWLWPWWWLVQCNPSSISEFRTIVVCRLQLWTISAWMALVAGRPSVWIVRCTPEFKCWRRPKGRTCRCCRILSEFFFLFLLFGPKVNFVDILSKFCGRIFFCKFLEFYQR